MINIIYEDKEIIICEKPSGVPSQSDKTGDEDLLSMLNNYLIESNKNNKSPYIAIVHRLDRAVGGIMVFAKTKESATSLSASIQKNKFTKTYLAIVNGQAKENEHLENHMLKNQRLNISKIAPKNTPNAKLAILDYNMITHIDDNAGEPLSLLKIDLITGRHHQIRVQLANAGIPIYGDTKYNPKFIKKPGFHYIALWAYKLKFPHPKTNEMVEFELKPHDKYPFDIMFNL